MSGSQSISIAAKLKEAGWHSIIYGFGSVAQSAVTLLLLPILTAALSKDDFGAYSLIAMVSTVASAVFYLGMTSALPRSYFDYTSEDDRRAVFTTAFIMLAFGALLQAMLGYHYASGVSSLLLGKAGYADAVAWALIGGALSFVNQYFFGYLRLLRLSVASVLFSLMALLGAIGLTFYFLALKPASVSAPFEAIAYSQAAITIVFLVCYGRAAFTLRIQSTEVAKLLHFGVASIIASFGHMLLDWTDRLIIEHYMTLADVGVYSAVFRVGMLINVVLILPFTQIWSPMMMEYRNKSNIKDLFGYVFSAFMILGGVVVAACALFAQDLLPLLIRSGVDAVLIPIFVIIISGVLIFGATNFVAAGLFYERKVYQLSYVYYGAALLKTVMNVLVVPMFGILGAAVSAFLAYVFMPVGIYFLAKRYFDFSIDWARLSMFAMLVAPSLAYGLLYGVIQYDIHPLLRMTWLGLTLVLVYFKCLSSTERAAAQAFFQRVGVR